MSNGTKRYLIAAMEGIPLGFPIGWMACNLSHGEYLFALLDIVGVIPVYAILIYSRIRQLRKASQ